MKLVLYICQSRHFIIVTDEAIGCPMAVNTQSPLQMKLPFFFKYHLVSMLPLYLSQLQMNPFPPGCQNCHLAPLQMKLPFFRYHTKYVLPFITVTFEALVLWLSALSSVPIANEATTI